MDRIAAKFVHGAAEITREIEVDSAVDPPETYSIWVANGLDPAPGQWVAGDPWEAVYVREANPAGEPAWIYRFRALVDPEE
ncbi:hypothetical protein Cme02nite_75640 [Catellatospora methionotrophica]|uniref:Uncharacterized protein n=1 Tax=Catellatospora methionotrophica TaxID=121620 RepID=A0A8J3PJ86_9ACTN|nr:hypothetical protein [Catellatospora methionotrophica]GIG19232.1 hypothetical protein Cme02nite_75640 [Catellatospora methionotrophica]